MIEKDFMPKISVVCPMYNVEKYVGECLESLLIQTLQDFEVIIVDDCSTDNSVEVVKSYFEKFEGRLRLEKSEKNSGGCAVPRNIGLSFARGKYVLFLDSDDLLLKDALEGLYEVAEKFQADVVQCEKFYKSEVPDLKGEILNLATYQRGKFVSEPVVEPYDITKRITDFHNFRYIWSAWAKLIRREFLEENQIKFPEILNTEDFIFAIFCLVCAKKYVRVPNVINIYRYRPGSIGHTKIDMIQYIKSWIHAMVDGFDSCDEFLSKLEFFQQNPDVKYLAFDCISQDVFVHLTRVYKSFSAGQLDEILRAEFAKSKNSSALTSFFFSMSVLHSMQIGSYILEKKQAARSEKI